MSTWTVSALLGATALVVMLALWFRQRGGGRAGDVDVAWALGLASAAVVHAVAGSAPLPRRVLVACIGAAWAVRLAWHLHRRLARRGEDGRYAALREELGERADRWLLGFFVFQALLVPVLGIAFGVAASAQRAALDVWDAAGLLVWVVAAAGEAVADAQLAAFVRDPANKGRTCRRGLWRYSRHPNYFFEWVHWLAWPLLAFGAPLWWLAVLPAVLMLVLIVRVTGIPPTEAQSLRSRGDDYRAYQRTTSAFVPWRPREEIA